MRGVRRGSIFPERPPFQDTTDRIAQEDEWHEAVTFAWHDATCHMAEDCPARDVHAHMWGTVPYEILFNFLGRLPLR